MTCVVRGGDVVHFIRNLGIIGSVESYKSPTFDITVFKLCNAFPTAKKASGVSGS